MYHPQLSLLRLFLTIVSKQHCPEHADAVRNTPIMPAGLHRFPASYRSDFHETIRWNVDVAGNVLPETALADVGTIAAGFADAVQ
jgi:hypothetical protein